MDAIWWVPTVVLAFGSLVLLWRLRALQRQVASSAGALRRVQDTGAVVARLADAAQVTRGERTRVAAILAPSPDR